MTVTMRTRNQRMRNSWLSAVGRTFGGIINSPHSYSETSRGITNEIVPFICNLCCLKTTQIYTQVKDDLLNQNMGPFRKPSPSPRCCALQVNRASLNTWVLVLFFSLYRMVSPFVADSGGFVGVTKIPWQSLLLLCSARVSS